MTAGGVTNEWSSLLSAETPGSKGLVPSPAGRKTGWCLILMKQWNKAAERCRMSCKYMLSTGGWFTYWQWSSQQVLRNWDNVLWKESSYSSFYWRELLWFADFECSEVLRLFKGLGEEAPTASASSAYPISWKNLVRLVLKPWIFIPIDKEITGKNVHKPHTMSSLRQGVSWQAFLYIFTGYKRACVSAQYMNATCMLHTTDTFLDCSELGSNSIIITYVC